MLVISKLRQIGCVARGEYAMRVRDPRMLLVLVLAIFAKTMVVDKLAEQAADVGTPLHILEPLVAMFGSNVLAFFIPFVFLILVSDFPSFSAHSLFVFIRTGKGVWLIGQILALAMIVLSYLLVLGAVCIIFGAMGGGEWGATWSDAVTKYAALFPEKWDGFSGQFITSNLYNQVSIFFAASMGFILVALNLFFFGMLLMLFQLLYLRTGGLLTCIAIMGLGCALSSANVGAMWCFPTAHTLLQRHYHTIASTPLFPIWGSVLYFVVGIVLVGVINYILLKRLNLQELV